MPKPTTRWRRVYLSTRGICRYFGSNPGFLFAHQPERRPDHGIGRVRPGQGSLKNPDHLDGVVVSSPFLGIHPDSKPSPIVMGASKFISRIAPRMMFSKVANPAYLSRDPEVERNYAADPLVSDKVSARWAPEVIDAQRTALAEASLMTIPALVMQAGDDRLVDPETTRAWVASAPADLVDYVEWEAYYHELFNEPLLERKKVFDKMESWLETH